MTETVDLMNTEVIDIPALSEEFVKLTAMSERAAELERAQKDRPLTGEEQEYLAKMPDIYRRAVQVTRILRRTNTGPAKVKTPRASKKAASTAKANSLLSEL